MRAGTELPIDKHANRLHIHIVSDHGNEYTLQLQEISGDADAHFDSKVFIVPGDKAAKDRLTDMPVFVPAAELDKARQEAVAAKAAQTAEVKAEESKAETYRSRILKPLADELGIPKLNFQVLRRTMATRAQNLGSVKDIQVAPAALASGHDGERVYAGVAGECAADGRDGLRDAHVPEQRRSNKGRRFEPVQPAQSMPTGGVWHQMASSLLAAIL